MELFIIISAVVLTLVGLAGSIIPVIPGVTLNFIAILMLMFSEKGEGIGVWAIVIFGILTALSWILDYVVPLATAKKKGASWRAILGAFLGMAIGLFVFSFIGAVIGMFFGAVIGETTLGKNSKEALKSGVATLWGTLFSMILNFLLSFSMTVYFFWKLVANW